MIPVDGLWDYFLTHRSELKNSYHLIADNKEAGVEIYLTEEDGFPYFSVEVDGSTEYETGTVSALDASKEYDDLLTMFIYSEDENDDEDSCRVQDIIAATEDLLAILIEEHPYDAGLLPEDVQKIAEMVEQYLFDNMGISVRHPTEVDGVIVQYPFGDSDGED